MSEHKGAIALVIAGLAMLGLWMFFNTDVMQPLLAKIGTKTTTMVDSIFGQFTEIKPTPTPTPPK